MKYVIVIGSGMADTRLTRLAGKTPMEALALNSFDRCAGCFCGRVLTLPRSMKGREDSAVYSILGYSPETAVKENEPLEAFREKFGHHGPVIGAVPEVLRAAERAGLKAVQPEGANGDIDTAYEAKVQAALEELQNGDDFALVHVNAPDKMAHDIDLGRKLEAIQNVEYRVVMPLINQLMGRGEDFRLLLVSDHATLLSSGEHSTLPVPWAIYDSREARKSISEGKKPPVRKFCEDAMLVEPVLMDGTDLIKVLFEQIR